MGKFGSGNSGGGGGGGSVAGSNTQIQYNNGGSFGGASGLVYDDSNHFVGIGAAPGTMLQVEGANAYITLKNSTDENGEGGAETKIIFEDHSNTALGVIQVSHDGTANDTKGDMIFYTSDATGSLGEGMRINSDHNVGIGVAGFAAKLKVKNNDVAQDCLVVDQNKAGRALYLDGAKKSGVNTVGANPVVSIQGGGSTQQSLFIQSNQDTGQTEPLIEFYVADSGFNQPVLQVSNSGSGDSIRIEDSGVTSFAISNQSGTDPRVAIGHGTPTCAIHLKGEEILIESATQLKPTLTLLNNTPGTSGSYGAVLAFKRIASDDAGENDYKQLGVLEFHGNDSANNADVFASIIGKQAKKSTGDEAGSFHFNVMAGGKAGTAALTEALLITGDRTGGVDAEVVVNDGSNDIDFRVETDNKTNALHVDASADSINMDAKLVGTRAGSATTLSNDGTIAVGTVTVNIDSSGQITGVRFASAGTAGQIIIVQNTGSDNILFHTTPATALVRGVSANNCKMLPGETHVLVSDGTMWNWIGGGTGISAVSGKGLSSQV